MLLISITSTAQVKITTSIDIKNAIEGSVPTSNKPALDLLVSARITDPYSGFTIAPSFEKFSKIDYTKYAFGVGYQFSLLKQNLDITPIIELNQTIRYEKWVAYTSYGGMIYFDYKINKKIYLTFLTSLQKREDLNQMYRNNKFMFNNSFGLSFEIQ